MPHDSRVPLRLLLVAGGETIPTWLFRCVTELEQSGVATVVMVWRAARAAAAGGRLTSGFGRGLRQVLFWVYQTVDRRLFRRSPDALAPVTVRFPLADCRAPLARTLADERIDVVLDPFSLLPDGSSAEGARYGVWSAAFGQSGDPKTQSAPGFWEVVDGRSSTDTHLCVHGRGRERTRSLYASVAPTDRRSVSRSQNHIYWKIAAVLARKLQTLWEDPDAFVGSLKAAPPFEVANGPVRVPGNGAMLRASSRLLRRYVADKWRSTFYREQWALAYRRGSGEPLEIEAFQTLMPPPDRFWADPFPVVVAGACYIFHEECVFSAGKGSIVVTVVDHRGTPVARCVPVLDEECHLSYPFVFQWDGDFFMIPETASRHRVELYRCVTFPTQWKLERVLLSGLRACDSTPAFLFGRWWLFSSVAAYGAGTTDALHAFHADSPLGPWTPHRGNPIKSDVRSARPAGRVFQHDGHFYRPAQDCSKHYGYAVSLNRILRLDPETYEEVEVDRIAPNGGPHVGVHTFNQAGEITVIDCLMRSRKF